MERKWWKEAVVYQIYPRSFCDSNGDGIGDIGGIISKLDYIKRLGVEVIWLCPVYKSPNDDNGYDISDYYGIMEDFGNLDDFDTLLREVHARGLKLIMDLVVNHTSDEHMWFIESRSSKQNPKRDYYIWRKGQSDREPNDWMSFFTPSAWKYDEQTGEYYLHLFSNKQPDLNWENPAVRDEIFRMMTWWLNRGIDGFRMDVINCISKAEGLPSISPDTDGYKWGGRYFLNGPHVHEYLQEMNRKVLSKYNCMTVGETPNVNLDDAALYTGSKRGELNMLFQSELMDIDSGESGKFDIRDFSVQEFCAVIKKWQIGLQDRGWNSLFFGNHDNPRAVSRFGNDGIYRIESAKMLATLLLTLQGTPFIYQGDEIGMTNTRFCTISDCRDIESIAFYRESLKKGADKTAVMEAISQKGRDNARTPMQWNSQPNAGFTKGMPWIGVNPNYGSINAAQSLSDPNSIFNFYAKLIQLRKSSDVLIYGNFEMLDGCAENVFAYVRVLEEKHVLVLLNMSAKSTNFNLPTRIDASSVHLMQSNYNEPPDGVPKMLRPYEAAIYSLNE